MVFGKLKIGRGGLIQMIIADSDKNRGNCRLITFARAPDCQNHFEANYRQSPTAIKAAQLTG